MDRTCPEHGDERTYVWPDVDHYTWLRSLEFPTSQPRAFQAKADKPCPQACGLCARHTRKATLVEIEVTQRCNIRCPVCFMAADEGPQDPSVEELAGFWDAIARGAGVDTGVQLTGGEPTIRDDLAEIIAVGRKVGFTGIEVNTNGIRIAQDIEYLRGLVASGLTGIYLQFDGLRESTYEAIRGARLMDIKRKAIENCRALGIQVVLAMTIVSSVNDDEIGDVVRFAIDNADVVIGVALQPAFTSGRFDTERNLPLTMGDVIFMLADQSEGMLEPYDIWPLGCSDPMCDTATYIVPNAEGEYLPATRGLTRDAYLSAYDPASPQGSVFADVLAGLGADLHGGISILIMNYMDAHTTDIKRLEQCSMLVTMADGRLIPFCSYQLSKPNGERLHQPWGLPVSTPVQA